MKGHTDYLKIGDLVIETSQEKLLWSIKEILGPNWLGLMNPAAGLNASFAHALAAPGKVAFATQSGALSTTNNFSAKIAPAMKFLHFNGRAVHQKLWYARRKSHTRTRKLPFRQGKHG